MKRHRMVAGSTLLAIVTTAVIVLGVSEVVSAVEALKRPPQGVSVSVSETLTVLP